METLPNYKICDGEFGRVLVLMGPWNSGVAKVMEKENVKSLFLHFARCWHDRDISFLSELPDLVSLEIIDWWLQDLKPIAQLSGLKSLSLSTYSKTKLDFKGFPHLEKLALHWIKGSETLFDLYELRGLFIKGLPASHVHRLRQLPNLQKLMLVCRGELDLFDIGQMSDLRQLSLVFFRSFLNLESLSLLTNLEDLEVISGQGFHSLEPLRGKNKLATLICDNVGDIPSLDPIAGLPLLERVSVSDSTNVVDGKISVLRTLPNLKAAHIRNRKHYDLKQKDFPISEARTIVWDPYWY